MISLEMAQKGVVVRFDCSDSNSEAIRTKDFSRFCNNRDSICSFESFLDVLTNTFALAFCAVLNVRIEFRIDFRRYGLAHDVKCACAWFLQ